MADTVATNVTRQVISAQVNVLQEQSTNIFSSASNNASVTICASNGSTTVVNGDINIKQFVSFNSSALIEASKDSEVMQKMQQQAEQVAKSVAQQFSLSGSEANNYSDSVLNMPLEVRQSTANVITNIVTNLTTVTVCGSDNSKTTLNGSINVEQGMNVVIEAIINDVMSSKTAQIASQLIKQSATAKTESFLTQLAMVIVAVAILFGVLTFGGLRQITQPKFLLSLAAIAVVFFILYVAAAYLFKWKPFKKA